ncbi:MAG: flagellar motor switch protein FliG, partial [Rhodospirillaceae bacterium]|nr:flagellar motor switch protein FliG [Rhodospirillaceae bacterium]MBT7511227.1 flagellar motor switch protein FliG [Rhodospirillaceae bacterium]
MAKIKDDYRGLTGPEKAAIFMLAVGNQHSAPLFEKMDDEEIRNLSQAMSSLGTVSAGIIERLFVEFADQLSSAG